MKKLMTHRITKYNPIFRNEEGDYTLQEWTEFTDINKIYNNQIFIFEEYLMTEKKYIESIFLIINSLNVKEVTLSYINLYYNNDNDPNIDLELYEIRDSLGIFNGSIVVPIEELKLFLKMNLRGLIRFDLIINNVNIIYFGYDFYMYLHTNIQENEFSILKQKIENIGLFVD